MGEQKGTKVLMVIGLYHPIVGGAEKVCQALSKSFCERGMTVTILTQSADGLPDYEVIDGIPVYRKMRGWHPLGVAYMLFVLWFLIKHRSKYDVIQCFGLFLFVPPALLMKYLFKKKVVLRILCSGHYGDFEGIKDLKFKRLIITASRRVDRIIYLSNDIKIELLHNRCPADKLVYIPNGVDSDRYKPLQEDESRRKKNICFVGRLSQQKGLEYLMRALPIVISKEYDTHLFIVGSGPQRAHLEDLSKRLRLNGHITFAGKQENVLSYYHNSALLVLPSESEGMSNVLLEAMACALPVVSTALGGNIELAGKVQQEMRCGERVRWILCENGILVPPQDAESLAEAIVQLLRNETLSRRMGTNARRSVEELYTLPQVIRRYTSLYEAL